MEFVIPFDWHRIFIGKEPPLYFLEVAFRVILIYGFAVFMLRYMGKRGQRQMTSFELVLVIALGSATGDSMLYPEVPILYAWLIISLIVGLNYLLAVVQFHSKRFNVFLEGKPRMMVRDGEILDASLRKELIRHDELLGLLREQELENTAEIRYVFLEPTGNIGIIGRKSDPQPSGESTFPENCDEST